MRFGLRTQLFVAGVLVLAVAAGISLWLLSFASHRLEDQAFDQLRSVRAEKARQVENEINRAVRQPGLVSIDDDPAGPSITYADGNRWLLPMERINDIMTSDRKWSEIGLGESGETYIVAVDGTMRNDSRFLLEDPEGYFAALDAASGRYDRSDVVETIKEAGTSVGLQVVDTEGTRDALAGNEGQAIFPDYREISVLSDYGPLDLPGGLDWVIMSEIDEAEAFGPADDLRRQAFVVLGVAGTLLFAGIWIASGKVTKPLKVMEHETGVVGELSFAAGDHYDSAPLDQVALRNDELGDLAGAFARLTGSLESNVSHRVAAEAELNVAADIQRSLLPLVFAEPPRIDEFVLHAALVPAAEVGGDFYDWGTISEDRYFFLVGDVSGKGVPAALFMAATKTLIRSGAMSGEPLDEMLTRVNAEIAESNPECMFATVWLGALDSTTGEITFVNAGHNPPLLDGEYLTESHGPMVGPIPEVVYSTGKFTMKPGQRLVVYSDGVTEAMDPSGVLYGEERFAALPLPESAAAATTAVVDAVMAYEQGTRSDDVTVLVLDYHGPLPMKALKVELPTVDVAEAVTKLNDEAEMYAIENGLPLPALGKAQLVLDEIISNIIMYGDANDIEVVLNFQPTLMSIAISDDGAEFDPLTIAEPDTTLGLHEREIGGLGMHLVRGVMSDVNYRYVNGRNVLEMTLEVE